MIVDAQPGVDDVLRRGLGERVTGHCREEVRAFECVEPGCGLSRHRRCPRDVAQHGDFSEVLARAALFLAVLELETDGAGFDDVKRSPTWPARTIVSPAGASSGDQPTGDLYVSNDWGVMRLPSGSNTWQAAGMGLPMVEVSGLTIVPGARKRYAATHGRSAWALTLP